jgi:hypothetical protein
MTEGHRALDGLWLCWWQIYAPVRWRVYRIVSASGRYNGFVLQVYGYLDMVAAFVSQGALDANLIYDTCQGM